jgi:hypothetical protein
MRESQSPHIRRAASFKNQDDLPGTSSTRLRCNQRQRIRWFSRWMQAVIRCRHCGVPDETGIIGGTRGSPRDIAGNRDLRAKLRGREGP